MVSNLCFFVVQLALINNWGEIYCEHGSFSQTNLRWALLGGLGWRSRSITSFLRTTGNCGTFWTTPFAKQRHMTTHMTTTELCNQNIMHYMNYNYIKVFFTTLSTFSPSGQHMFERISKANCWAFSSIWTSSI